MRKVKEKKGCHDTSIQEHKNAGIEALRPDNSADGDVSRDPIARPSWLQLREYNIHEQHNYLPKMR